MSAESSESPGSAGARSNAKRCGESIERCITRLVQEAPALDADTVAELVAQLRDMAATAPDAAGLARSIAQVVELVAAGRIDPGIALPHLAMACATLVDPALTAREREAARYEIDTLLPGPNPPQPAVPDVPIAALIRGPRPRT